MTSAIKSFLILLLTLPLLIYIGSEIGNDDYLVPIVAGVLMLACLVFGLFFRGQRMESIILLMLLGGYIIGNRGFAQLYIVQPLFVGELGMVAILAAMVCRYAVSRELIVAPHVLTRLVALYLACALGRLFFDWRSYGVEAVRDSALAYYAVFFFAAYQLGRHAEASEFFDRTLVRAFYLLGIIAAIGSFEPDWLEVLSLRGTPLLLQKLDITATFCSMGILFITIRTDLARSRLARSVTVALMLICILLSGSRAALVALGAALLLPWIAARRGFITFPLLLLIFGVSGVFIFGANSTGRLATARDQLTSITDVSGTYHYQTELGDIKQADNNFRRALWDSIFKQTLQDKEWIAGKGFGYNFIPAFEQEYRNGSWDSLRSAHNYYVTVFGRMGLLGFGLFVAISFEVIRLAVRAALALRRKEQRDPQSLAYWCAVWAILVSGSFGVVLEGPMGAIPFWSFLGLALASDDRKRLEARAEETAVPVLEITRERQGPTPRPALAR